MVDVLENRKKCSRIAFELGFSGVYRGVHEPEQGKHLECHELC